MSLRAVVLPAAAAVTKEVMEVVVVVEMAAVRVVVRSNFYQMVNIL